MVVIKLEGKPFGQSIRQRLGKPFEYGEREMGSIKYGEIIEPVGPGQHGIRIYGETDYGDAFAFAGIYQVRHHRIGYLTLGEKETGELYVRRSKFYVPKNPNSEAQQSKRSIFTAGVLSWQSLSEDEKNIYRERAEGLEMSGFNLFLSEYLLNN